MPTPRHVRTALFLLVIAIYIAARIWRLDAACLWFDEIFSVQAAEQPWSQLLRFVSLDIVHPPLFYVILKLWVALGGESTFWLRSISVLFAVLSIVPFVYLSREIGRGKDERWWPVLALFLLAVNGSLIKYAQEVRMYTMLMFVGLISMWLFARFFHRGKSWVWLVVINILLVWTHYYGWLVIGSEVAAILIYQRMKWRRIAAMAGIVFAAFLPWLIAIINAARSGDLGQNIEWIERPGPIELVTLALKLIEPFYFQTTNIEPPSLYLISIPIFLLCGVAAILWLAANDWDKDGVKLVILFAAMPLITAFAASWALPYSVWGTRHLIVIAVPVAILAAVAITRIPHPGFRTAAVTLIVLFSGYAFYRQAVKAEPEYVWCVWEKMVSEIKPESKEPVAVYTSENLAAYHTWFRTRKSTAFDISIVPDQSPSSADREYFIPRGTPGVRMTTDLNTITASHIVLIYRIEEPVLNDRLLQEMRKIGYSGCPPEVRQVGPSTAVRAEMTREAGKCIY